MSDLRSILQAEYRGMYDRLVLTPKSSRRMMGYRGLLSDGASVNDQQTSRLSEHTPANYNSGTRYYSDGVITSNFNINTITQNTSTSDRCCSCCAHACQRLRSCLGQTFCITKTNRLCKILVSWLMFIVISAILGFSVRFSVFGTVYREELSRGDQYLIPDHLAPTFCQSAILESDAHFEAYLLTTMPQVDENLIRSYRLRANFSLRNSWYKVLQFNLLYHSAVTTYVCPQKEMELYIIQGQQNFDMWTKYRACPDCYIKYGHLREVPATSCHEHYQWYNIIATKTDDYFFVLNRPFKDNDQDLTTAFVYMDFNRTTYDLEPITKQNCSDVQRCQLDFDAFSKQHIVLENHYPTRWLHYHNITISCKPRLLTYGVIFILLPVVLCTALSVFISVKCKNPEHRPIIEGSVIRDSSYSTSITNSCESNFSTPSSDSDEQRLVDEREHSLPIELINHI